MKWYSDPTAEESRASIFSFCASRLLAPFLLIARFVSFALADDIPTSAVSPVVSYQYAEDLNIAELAKGATISPTVSYQYVEWPGDSTLGLLSSPLVGYSFQEVAIGKFFVRPSLTTPAAAALAFDVPTDLGKRYVIEFKKTLIDPAWSVLRTIVGDGQLQTFFEEIKDDASSLFLRVGRETEEVRLDLKLPLPGGKNWYLTVETGGRSNCGESIDEHHLPDARYFALDFDDLRAGEIHGVHEDDVPVLAAAHGWIVRQYESTTYGWTVIIDHDSPYVVFPSPESGYTTLYAHMKAEPIVKEGDEVFLGDQIGIVGSTGISTGTHVHFEVRYDGDSRTSVQELRLVRLEGLPLETYRVGCNSSGTGFFPSTNTRR